MCLYLEKDNPIVLIADKDITCYKVLRTYYKTLHSPYQYFDWELNKLYTVKLPLKKDARKNDRGIINKGLHSFSMLKRAKSSGVFLNYNGRKIYKAIIPKGSYYYYNSDKKEYASNQLIIIKKVR